VATGKRILSRVYGGENIEGSNQIGGRRIKGKSILGVVTKNVVEYWGLAGGLVDRKERIPTPKGEIRTQKKTAFGVSPETKEEGNLKGKVGGKTRDGGKFPFWGQLSTGLGIVWGLEGAERIT